MSNDEPGGGRLTERGRRLVLPPRAMAVIFLIVAVALMVRYLSHKKFWYYFDSKIYVSMANNYLEGRTFTSNLHDIETHTKRHEFNRAPLYPAVIPAASSLTGAAPIGLAGFLSLIAFAVGIGLLALWLSRYFNFWIALAAAGIGTVSLPVFLMATAVLSEPVFFFGFVGFFLALEIYRERGGIWWLVSAVSPLSVFCFLVRYVGVGVVPVAVGVILTNKSVDRSRRLKHLTIYLLIFSVFAVGMAAVNHHYTGSITGKPNSPSDVGFITNVRLALEVVANGFWQIGSLVGKNAAGSLVQMILFLGLLAVIIGLGKLGSKFLLVWMAPVSFVGVMVILRSFQDFAPIDRRLLGPAMPIVNAVLFAVLVTKAVSLASERKFVKAAPFFILLVMATYGRVLAMRDTDRYFARERLYWNTPWRSQALGFVRGITGADEVVIGNRPAMSIIMLPDAPEFIVLDHIRDSLNLDCLTPEKLSLIVKECGVRYMIFGVPDLSIPRKRYGPFVDEIISGEQVPGIRLLKTFEDGWIYDISDFKNVVTQSDDRKTTGGKP